MNLLLGGRSQVSGIDSKPFDGAMCSTKASAVNLTLPSVRKQIAKKHKQRQRESKQLCPSRPLTMDSHRDESIGTWLFTSGWMRQSLQWTDAATTSKMRTEGAL